MSSCKTGILKLKTSDFIIQTCTCHYSIWKRIRDKNDETWEFDDIECDKKSFRKLFHQKMTIFHYCFSCFEKIIMLNPIILRPDANTGHCLRAKFLNICDCQQMCNACVWLFIEMFKNEIFAL